MKLFDFRKPRTWQSLLQTVLHDATHSKSDIHGEKHWRAVAAAGIEIARRHGGCPAVALAFGMIHDCQRLNDDWDPLHGARAAEWARKSRIARDLLGPYKHGMLVDACHGHDDGQTTTNAIVGACWDADRINLWRVGIRPDFKYFSALDQANFTRMSEYFQRGWRTPPTWDEVIAQTEGVTS